jgi:hypothetical protein
MLVCQNNLCPLYIPKHAKMLLLTARGVNGDFSEQIPAGIPRLGPQIRGFFAPRGRGKIYPRKHFGAGIGEASLAPQIPRPR